MEYTNWDSLVIVLYQNGIEINSHLIMRRDISTTDSLSVKNILSEVSNSMVLDTIKTQNGLSDCKNWDEISVYLMFNNEIHKDFKSTRSNFENNQYDLGYFLYDIFVTLTVDKVDTQQIYKTVNILYSEELITKQEELILNQPEPIFYKISTIDTKNVNIGDNTLVKNKKGIDNVALGPNSLNNNVGSGNTGIGKGSLATNRDGSNNTGNGRHSLAGITRGNENVGVGFNSGKVTSKGQNNNESNRSTFLGSNTKPLNDKSENEIVIGADSVGNGSNTTTIGNNKTKDTYIHGVITSDGYKSSDGSMGITTKFKTIDGLTVTIKNGLVVSIQ